MFTANALANSAHAQRQLLHLNLDFLQLLRNAPLSIGARCLAPSLARELFVTLAQCQHLRAQRLAECGFALFSLSLHRAAQWRQVVAHSGQRDAYWQHGEELVAAQAQWQRQYRGFVQCALFFAWHLTQQQPRQARLLLGMCEECMEMVTALDLWQCRYIARTQPLLTLRWHAHPYFWTDMLRYGESGEAMHCKRARWSGTQLTAQELEPGTLAWLSKAD